jgi:predicted nucleotidyltransferase
VKIFANNFPESLARFQESLQQCLKAFEKALPIERVILFGSHARNQAGSDSDVDLCLVIPGIQSQYRSACTLRTAIGTIRDKPPFSLIPISPERLAEKMVNDDPFFGSVIKEGICIAEKD